MVSGETCCCGLTTGDLSFDLLKTLSQLALAATALEAALGKGYKYTTTSFSFSLGLSGAGGVCSDLIT